MLTVIKSKLFAYKIIQIQTKKTEKKYFNYSKTLFELLNYKS